MALPPATPSGLDLRAERARRGLTAADVAELLGVSRRRVTTVENQWRPSRGMVARYLAAVSQVDQP